PRILVCEGASSDLSLDSWAAEPPPAETPTAAAPVAETAATATSAPPGTGLAAVPYGDLAALEEALAGREVAAFVVEPIQVEAGAVDRKSVVEGKTATSGEQCRRMKT